VADQGRPDELPDTVQGIIAARLDTLSRDEKELLQDASVVGKVFWSGALASMHDRERSTVEERLHGLDRKEFVRRERRSSVAGETEYAFRHILVRDVAYGQIPRADRAERHVLAARWMESLGRPADHAELLANHYLAAIELARISGSAVEPYAERARTAFAEAGDRASSLNAFAAAARYFRAALELTTGDDPGRPSLLFRFGKALRISEEAGADVLAEAEAGLRAAGELAIAAEAAVLQAELAWFAGDGDATNAHLDRAARLVDGLPPSFSKAYVLSDLSRYHMLGGRSEEAISVGSQALEIAEAMGFDEIRAHAMNNVGTARGIRGDDAGIADLEAALGIAAAANSLELPRVMNNLAALLWESGDFKKAASLFREGLIRARELGNASVARFMEGMILDIDYFEGGWDDSLEAVNRIISEAESGRPTASETQCRVERARIHFARGDRDGAFEDAERAVALARRSGVPTDLEQALAVKAWLLIETGDAAGADALVSEAQVVRRGRGAETAPTEFVLALLALHREADVAELAAALRPGVWCDAATLAAADRLAEAADLHEATGERSPAALYRFAAAEALEREGRRADAEAQLELAITFWTSVRATHYLAKANALATRLTETRRSRPKDPARR
jgi:tetratricopeptide (TPR) repeat protein